MVNVFNYLFFYDFLFIFIKKKMFSLIKSVFSNIQNEDDLKILIIGEGGSGKSSLFNLISSYNNKSKYEILNTSLSKNISTSNCALGFNTTKIRLHKNCLKIYDLQGTEDNTIEIYDCYYHDSDVIFYVIDSKYESHIFKTIIYLSCLSMNNEVKKKKDNEQFIKPIIILANKSDDGTSFFSAPCISNYIKSIDIYKNDTFWQYALSNDNIFLNYYLNALYDELCNYFLIDNISLEDFLKEQSIHTYNDNNKNSDDHLNIQDKKKMDNLINDIKQKNKISLTINDIEDNKILMNLLKQIINQNIINYKNMPIEVYNISVHNNKGIYEILLSLFEKKYQSKYDKKYINETIKQENSNTEVVGTRSKKKETNVEDNINTQQQTITYLNSSKNKLYNGSNNNLNNQSFLYTHPNDTIVIESENNDTNGSSQNNNFLMYEYDNKGINLFIDHMQYLYFNKEHDMETFPEDLYLWKQDNLKYKKELNCSKKKKKKLLKGIQEKINVKEIGQHKQYDDPKILKEDTKELEEKCIIEKESDNISNETYKKNINLDNKAVETKREDDENILFMHNPNRIENKNISLTNNSINNPIEVKQNTMIIQSFSDDKATSVIQNDTPIKERNCDDYDVEKKIDHMKTIDENLKDKERKATNSFLVEGSTYEVGEEDETKEEDEEIYKGIQKEIYFEKIEKEKNNLNDNMKKGRIEEQTDEQYDNTYIENKKINDASDNNQMKKKSYIEKCVDKTNSSNNYNSINKKDNYHDKTNYIYKNKINKKRYTIIEKIKKKKKKFLFKKKELMNNTDENSSNSVEDVNTMNIMQIDSLNEI
ncbi:conserved Plasmodium protein, unknown function [Plasmodium gaboni]|uniref:G domain-containing protein n=1 Tax=Plasmodium gaboni TaxID=647221 RepID=A0ABY1UUA4_9APIC|nr:conserved Plasmodium protein, unknown function [Plasmodium gaboni]